MRDDCSGRPATMRPENLLALPLTFCVPEKKNCPGIAQAAFRHQHKLLTFY